MVDIKPIKLKGHKVKLHKAIVNPALNTRTVLTNSPWDFVELWLKKKKENKALFYWNQAREFHKASSGLSTRSSPLLHYYSFLNAVKALLASKKIIFHEQHGVTSHNMRGNSKKINITNEGVKILNKGVLPSLSDYLGERETKKTHSLKELLFNLPYIHRTYCLTYTSQTNMFIPLRDCQYVVNKKNGVGYFRAKLSVDYSSHHVVKRLPSSFALEEVHDGDYIIKSTLSTQFNKPSKLSLSDIKRLCFMHRELREDLCYINGAQTLWYIKAVTSGTTRLTRFPSTITLAAMHRLSELCRYQPLEFDYFLSGRQNWLLSEFIQQSSVQFFDEIAAEITGHLFLVPNIRPAS